MPEFAASSQVPEPKRPKADSRIDRDLLPPARAADAAQVDPATVEGEEGHEKPTRRLWKKKDMPGGLWLKCESCGQMIYRKELEEKGRVCPACDFHFTLPGRDRVRMVIDEGSFEERYAELAALDRLHFQDSVPYGEKIKRSVAKLGQNEALICGTGTIEGRPVVLAVLDFSFMGGSMGEVVGEKISLACDLARKERKPLVVFTSSGGARMHEGMLSLMQMAKTSAALAALAEVRVPFISVLTDPTTGGVSASLGMLGDVNIAEPKALIGFAGPRVIQQTVRETLPEGFQRSEFLLDHGAVDMIVDRRRMRDEIAILLAKLTKRPAPEA